MKKIISLLIALVMVSAICIGSAITAAALQGDVNNDGEVNNKDVVSLFRYVSGGEKAEDESIYDYNEDGEVNNKDVVALFRALSAVTGPEDTEDTAEEEATEEITEADETSPEETSAEEETDVHSDTEEGGTEPEETGTEPEQTETEPEDIEPEETEPDETEPDETEPDETEPDETEPDVTESDETEGQETEAYDPDTWLCKKSDSYTTGWWMNPAGDPTRDEWYITVKFTTPKAFRGFVMACYASPDPAPAHIQVSLLDENESLLETQEITVKGDHNNSSTGYITVEFENAHAKGTYTVTFVFTGGAHFVLGCGEPVDIETEVSGSNFIEHQDKAPAMVLLGTDLIPGDPEDTVAEETEEPQEVAEFSIPRVFADHMVIQRDQPIKVWGTSANNGAVVRGQFMGEEALGEVKDGKWEIEFSPKSATFDPQTLTVEDSCGNKIEYTDILVGDVWLIGGQSNAEATYKDIYTKLEPDGTMPLRVFQQGALFVMENPELAAEPSDDIINPKWMWKISNRSGAEYISLLGWFFGCKLVKETDVPIGVVSIAASGAALSELMPKELSDSLGIKAGTNRYYNALTHPFLKMKFTGMVFCQGESESMMGSSTPPMNYAKNFEALMTELRSRWGFDFPIYNVQLSDYTEQSTTSTLNGKANAGYIPNVGVIRSQQFNAYKNMEGVRLIPSYDLGPVEGYGNFLHPPYKKELGERAADLVLAEIYGVGTVEAALAPEPVEVKVISSDSSGKTINIKFKNVGEGLAATDGGDTVSGFITARNPVPNGTLKEIVGKIISSDTVQVTVTGTAKNVYVGYACAVHVPKTDVKLVNSYGLPALAFYLPAEY